MIRETTVDKIIVYQVTKDKTTGRPKVAAAKTEQDAT